MAYGLIEALIRALAIGAGLIALIAPLVLLQRASHTESAGEADAMGASTHARRALASNIILVLIGVILWRPVPLVFSARADLVLDLLGGLLYFPAVSLYLWGLRSLGRVFRVSSVFAAQLPPDHSIVERGPYRVVRHPMYLGVIVAAAGALLIFRTWAMVLFFPLSFIVIGRARREEVALAQRYGETWVSYTDRVPPWIPKPA
jgi:protein-S-isoprenylcysteine O-methyltransferase Ste14